MGVIMVVRLLTGSSEAYVMFSILVLGAREINYWTLCASLGLEIADLGPVSVGFS